MHYNEKIAAPFFVHTDNKGVKREVWFEDARSILAKYRLVKEYNLAGMGGWRLGLAFPQAETLFLEVFTIFGE